MVLVHGLGRSRASMMVLAQRLEWAGFGVITVDYNSLSAPFPERWNPSGPQSNGAVPRRRGFTSSGTR